MAKHVNRKNNTNRQKGGDLRKNRGDDPTKNRGDPKSPVRGNKKIIGKASREILTKKIGKAQKGKKHKKIKAIDPFYHGDRKNIYDKKKMLNKAPKNEDDDYFPGRLKEILRLKEELKNRKQKKPKREKSEQTSAEPNTKKTYTSVPSFWPKPERRRPSSQTDGHSNEDENNYNPMYIPEGQKKGESAISYLRRANRDLSDVYEKTILFKKFDISFTDMNTGKMEKLYGMNDKKRRRLKEIAKAKKQRKLEKQSENKTGFDHLKDNVEFGEITMAPPEKLAKPRHADSSKLLQPGKKELLLKKMVEQKSVNPTEQTPTKSSKTPTKKDKYSLKKTVKLKHLPPVKQLILNEERERVVQLYREMKKKNQTKNE